jgi:BTB/POZ domain-containing protein KCTD9
MPVRLNYDLSCARLRELGLLAHDNHPPMPERLPQYDDSEPLGFSIFRTLLDDALDLSDLTLPRTFFGRSQIDRVSFRNSDLHESNLCWNDFNGTDFSGADLGSSICVHRCFTTFSLLPPISMAQICDNRLSLNVALRRRP